MINKVHNLDENLSESFDFIIKGHTYRFKYLTLEEGDALRALSADEYKTREFLFDFITPVSEGAPQFRELHKSILIPQWNKYVKMILDELGVA